MSTSRPRVPTKKRAVASGTATRLILCIHGGSFSGSFFFSRAAWAPAFIVLGSRAEDG